MKLIKSKWVVHVSTQNFEEEKNIVVIAYDEQEAKRKALKKVSDKFAMDYLQKVDEWREDKEVVKP